MVYFLYFIFTLHTVNIIAKYGSVLAEIWNKKNIKIMLRHKEMLK